MPAVVEETIQSRKKSIKSREREYKISGATDDDEALTEGRERVHRGAF